MFTVVTMPSVQCLRQFFNDRLAAAAEEIFNVVEKTIVEYEQEINRQRKLLTVVWEPRVKLHRTELPQKYVCKPDEIVADEQPVNQERNSSLHHQHPEPPQIKEEQENLCISQDEEELKLKQEPDTCMQTLTNGKGDLSENETLFLNSDESHMATEEKSLLEVLVNNSEISELHTNHQLLSHDSHFSGSQDRSEGKHTDSVSTGNGETKPQKRHFKTNNVHNPAMFKNDCIPLRGEKSFKCDTCGKTFSYNSKLIRHLRIHTGEKPYLCNVCGKRFNQQATLKAHKRIHTGERPYRCDVCDKRFNQESILKVHRRTHTGERPFICNICGKGFNQLARLTAHKTTHTGERPYRCDVCDKRFNQESILKVHRRTHTGERPFACGVCGKRFTRKWILDNHFITHKGQTDAFMVTLTYDKGDRSEDPTLCLNPEGSQMAAKEECLDHISEIPELNLDYQSLDHRGAMLGGSVSTENEDTKPQEIHYETSNEHDPTMLEMYYDTPAYQNSFKCETCGKTFQFQSILNRHLRVHTGEKPYFCNICGKGFSQTSILKVHNRIHTGERPHSCSICGKSFNQKVTMNIHKRIHTGEKPFSCHICGKQFSQKSILDVHVRTHTGEKPYSCKTCGKHHRSNCSLLVHMKTHTDEPYY